MSYSRNFFGVAFTPSHDDPLKWNEKPCSICLEVKPMSDFYKDSSHPTGKRPDCKICCKISPTKRKEIKNSIKKSFFPMGWFESSLKHNEKFCTKCGVLKSLDNFNKNRQSKGDGFRPSCKDCQSKKPNVAYYLNNDEYLFLLAINKLIKEGKYTQIESILNEECYYSYGGFIMSNVNIVKFKKQWMEYFGLKYVLPNDTIFIDWKKQIELMEKELVQQKEEEKRKKEEQRLRVKEEKNRRNQLRGGTTKTYLMKDKSKPGIYKIGKSVDPNHREKTLQSETPFAENVKVWNKNIETILHNYYDDYRVRGEWFKLTPIQIRFICTNDWTQVKYLKFYNY